MTKLLSCICLAKKGPVKLSSMNSKFNSSGVDDNSFSSVNSEFDSSILNFSELNSSISDTYSFVLEDTEERTESLKFYYTNADCLLNKMGELEILLDQSSR